MTDLHSETVRYYNVNIKFVLRNGGIGSFCHYAKVPCQPPTDAGLAALNEWSKDATSKLIEDPRYVEAG